MLRKLLAYYEEARAMPAKYVTVGFDSEARAEQFLNLIKGNGNLVRLAELTVDPETNKKSWKINNLQARAAHMWQPMHEWERRRVEFDGVIIEFKDQETAIKFLELALNFLAKQYNYDQSFVTAATDLATLIDHERIAGIKLERG